MHSDYIDHTVVIDTDTPLTYIGRLAAIDGSYLKLAEVTMHDSDQSRLSTDAYLAECAELGARPSRRELLLRLPRVVSISKLADIVVPGRLSEQAD